MVIHGYRIALLTLCLAGMPAHAEIHKCRQGERVIYQSQPCPAGSVSLKSPELPPQPSAFAAEEARARARHDITAAEALRARERKEAEARDRQAAAEAKKLEEECERLRGALEREETRTKVKPGKQPKTSEKQSRREYLERCEPL